MQWGVCLDSIPQTSSISTRNTPVVQHASTRVKMTNLFVKLEGSRTEYKEERFVILFASGTKQSSHFDILCSSENQFIFTARDLPRIARKYWRIQKPVEQVTNWQQQFGVEDEFQEIQRAPSPPDSPPWQSVEEDNISTSHVQDPLLVGISVKASKRLTLPEIRPELMIWKKVFVEIFKHTNRSTFSQHVRPMMVTNFSYCLETHFKRITSPETVRQMEQGIRDIVEGIWLCFDNMTLVWKQNVKRQKRPNVRQHEVESYILSEAMIYVPEIRDSLMFFIKMIANNISIYNQHPVSFEDVLIYCGFYSAEVSKYTIHVHRWIFGTKGNPDQNPPVQVMTADVAAVTFRSAFTHMIERTRACRNSNAHAGKPFIKLCAAELILLFAVLSGLSNMNPQQCYDMEYNKTQWYK